MGQAATRWPPATTTGVFEEPSRKPRGMSWLQRWTDAWLWPLAARTVKWAVRLLNRRARQLRTPRVDSSAADDTALGRCGLFASQEKRRRCRLSARGRCPPIPGCASVLCHFLLLPGCFLVAFRCQATSWLFPANFRFPPNNIDAFRCYATSCLLPVFRPPSRIKTKRADTCKPIASPFRPERVQCHCVSAIASAPCRERHELHVHRLPSLLWRLAH